MKAVFLDRDGVINRYPGDRKYVTSWREFRFLPRAKAAIARLHKEGFKIFVISNQAGVGKGLYTQRNLDRITKNMLLSIGQSEGKIEAVYYCTHRKEENCACRKPKSGLIDIARKKYPSIPKGSFIIGDTIRDVHTAKASGCKSILVMSGKEKLANRADWEAQPDFVFKDLFEAVEFLTSKK